MTDYTSLITSGLIARGFSPVVATGVTAGAYAESGGNITATNPSSNAYGIGQWLGARKQSLFAFAGTTAPTFEQQLDYMASELRGGDPGGKAVLAQTTPQGVLKAFITRFERPAAGAETDGDLSRGNAYLASLNAQTNKTIGDSLASFGLGAASNAVGNVLTAPAQMLGAATDKVIGGLNPSAWFQRIALAILAILLIGIALSMLAGKPALALASRLPVPV